MNEIHKLNEQNLKSTSDRTDTDFNPIGFGVLDIDSNYHNSVRVNGKNNIGRTIRKMNNKLWHKLNS